MRHGEKCWAVLTAGRVRSTAEGSGENRRSRAASSPSAPNVAPGGHPASAPRRNRPSQTAPGCAGTGGAMAAASRTASNSVPSRPADNSRTPAKVAGRGAAARAETDRVAGGNGAPAIVCNNAARTGGCERLPRQQSEALWPHRDTFCQTGSDCASPARAQPAGSHGGRNQGGGRRAGAVAVAPQQAQARTQRRRIVVRGVLDPCHADRPQRRAQSRRRHRQQRTQQTAAFVVSTSGAMPAMPAGPLPPSARISSVSA